MEKIIIIPDGAELNCYKVSLKKGFKETREEIKENYSIISPKKYHCGYFNPYKKKFVINDYDLKEYDELDVTECVKKHNSQIYSNHESYQVYMGKVRAYTYPKIYKILTQDSFEDILVDLNNFYSTDTEYSTEEKERLFQEIFKYINFELLMTLSKDEIEDFLSKLQFEEKINILELSNINHFITEEQNQKKNIRK